MIENFVSSGERCALALYTKTTMLVSRFLALLCFVVISPVLSAPVVRLRGAVVNPRHPMSKGHTVTNLKTLDGLTVDHAGETDFLTELARV